MACFAIATDRIGGALAVKDTPYGRDDRSDFGILRSELVGQLSSTMRACGGQ